MNKIVKHNQEERFEEMQFWEDAAFNALKEGKSLSGADIEEIKIKAIRDEKAHKYKEAGSKDSKEHRWNHLEVKRKMKRTDSDHTIDSDLNKHYELEINQNVHID